MVLPTALETYSYRRELAKQREQAMWDTPMGQNLNTGLNWLNIGFSWLNTFLGFPHADGTPYTWSEFGTLKDTFFGNSRAPTELQKPLWDRPAWEVGTRRNADGTTIKGLEFGRRHETVAPGSAYATPGAPDPSTRPLITKADVKDNVISYTGTAAGQSFTLDKGTKDTNGQSVIGWAANNPGLLHADTEVSDLFHAVGRTAEGYAVFPDAVTGLMAQIYDLEHRYNGMTVAKMISDHIYVMDAATGQNPYVKLITDATGIDPEKDIDNLSAQERGKIAREIANVYGWAPGKAVLKGDLSPEARAAVLEDQGLTTHLQRSQLQATWDAAGDPLRTLPAPDTAQQPSTNASQALELRR